VTPGCEWVLAGEGVATRKWDGTAVLVREGRLYARYDAKKGKIPPAGSIPCTEAPDPVTGHWPHWAFANGPQHKWIREAFERATAVMMGGLPDGTYEAVGPRINSNADCFPAHILVKHGIMVVDDLPLSFAGLRLALQDLPWEGLVFHHPDGRMCKIRRDDFGLRWPL
jgi:hypothetical protein